MIKECEIKGVYEITPDVFTDFRGDLWTLWKKDEFSLLNLINISAFNINLFPYLLGLTIGIITKLRVRWI